MGYTNKITILQGKIMFYAIGCLGGLFSKPPGLFSHKFGDECAHYKESLSIVGWPYPRYHVVV